MSRNDRRMNPSLHSGIRQCFERLLMERSKGLHRWFSPVPVKTLSPDKNTDNSVKMPDVARHLWCLMAEVLGK